MLTSRTLPIYSLGLGFKGKGEAVACMGAKIIGACVVLVTALLLSGCAQIGPSENQNNSNGSSDNMQKISFISSDGVSLVGDFYPADSNAAVVLVHQLGSTKESWGTFPAFLNQKGFSVLAIDLRGHGQSGAVNGKRFDRFNANDWQGITLDVKSAVDFLKNERKVKTVYLAGASIGANAVLNAGAAKNVSRVVMLSPGLDYRGYGIDPSAINSFSGKALILVSQEDDYPFSSSRELHTKLGEDRSELVLYSRAGHGVTILSSRVDAKNKILEFLKDD